MASTSFHVSPPLTIPPGITAEEIESVRRVLAVMPSCVDGRWKNIDGIPGQLVWVNRVERLSAILSAAPKDDGHWWLHFSVAHRDRLPTWGEFVRAKETFLGPETKAVQVLAPRSQWVNIHPFALHLWVCLDGDPLPDFTEGLGTI